ncbi:MAG: peptidylprolyl isomerase [Methanospirillum sp.]|nr:peptidylprolyl isomerase [Methanospirillum sp.]
MAVIEKDYIRVEYTGSVDGIVFDTTSAEEAKNAGIENPSATYGPILVRVGSGHVIPGLDDALVGREVDEEAEIDVPPEKGFGVYDRELVEGVPLKQFPEKIQVGSRVRGENREGIVRDIIGSRAIVDYNNEFAGKTLHYRFRVVEVVEDELKRAKGLIRLYGGRDLEPSIEEGTMNIELPPGIGYDRRWMLWKPTIVRDIFEAAPSIGEIRLFEVMKRPEPQPELELVEEEAAGASSAE